MTILNEYADVLKRAKLFSGIERDDLSAALVCLNASVRIFAKHDFIFREGEEPTFAGVILSGEVQTRKTDYSGNSNIVSKLYASDCIAASACYATDRRLPFDAVCASTCDILCLDAGRVIRPCCNSCTFHIRLIQNLLNIIADRNLTLAGKIDILTKRTLREKILAYLHAQSARAKNLRFSIPLSRVQMAEFLSVNRSALSRELCALRDEGLLCFDKNIFLLKAIDRPNDRPNGCGCLEKS